MVPHGPALIILSLGAVRKFTNYHIDQSVTNTLALIMAVSLQISLFFAVAEIFTDFYNYTAEAASIRYLFFGLHGVGNLNTWIWSSMAMNLVAVFILMVHPLRNNVKLLYLACVLGFIGIWIEKGMGLVVPGFIPTTLGEVFEYTPTGTEISIAIGIWSFGILVFTVLVKLVVSIETGKVRQQLKNPSAVIS